MLIKTSKLTTEQIDYVVAILEGHNYWRDGSWTKDAFTPSKNWYEGGPIIERISINICRLNDLILTDYKDGLVNDWAAHIDGLYTRHGPTPLMAAMRCYIASELGYEVEIPEDLL